MPKLAKLDPAKRIVGMKTRLSTTTGEKWEKDFVKECQAKEEELKRTCAEEWPKIMRRQTVDSGLHKQLVSLRALCV